jgi:hypothetical protein
VTKKKEDELPVSRWLIGFFIIVVVGSSLVEVMNLFSRSSVPEDD